MNDGVKNMEIEFCCFPPNMCILEGTAPYGRLLLVVAFGRLEGPSGPLDSCIF